MYVYVYVCICICICIYVFIWIYMYIWVQIPLRPTFYRYFSESFSGEYRKYQFIPLQSYDYLCEISLKANMATGEGNGRNETLTLNKEMKLE